MSEICLECWNKINGTEEPESKYVLSDNLELCEECMELKHIIVAEQKPFDFYKLVVYYFLMLLGFLIIQTVYKIIIFVCSCL